MASRCFIWAFSPPVQHHPNPLSKYFRRHSSVLSPAFSKHYLPCVVACVLGSEPHTLAPLCEHLFSGAGIAVIRNCPYGGAESLTEGVGVLECAYTVSVAEVKKMYSTRFRAVGGCLCHSSLTPFRLSDMSLTAVYASRRSSKGILRICRMMHSMKKHRYSLICSAVIWLSSMAIPVLSPPYRGVPEKWRGVFSNPFPQKIITP